MRAQMNIAADRTSRPAPSTVFVDNSDNVDGVRRLPPYVQRLAGGAIVVPEDRTRETVCWPRVFPGL